MSIMNWGCPCCSMHPVRWLEVIWCSRVRRKESQAILVSIGVSMWSQWTGNVHFESMSIMSWGCPCCRMLSRRWLEVIWCSIRARRRRESQAILVFIGVPILSPSPWTGGVHIESKSMNWRRPYWVQVLELEVSILSPSPWTGGVHVDSVSIMSCRCPWCSMLLGRRLDEVALKIALCTCDALFCACACN